MRALDLTNQVFGCLTAKSPTVAGSKRGWNCECSCGKKKWVPTFQLTCGKTKTCGCGLHRQSIKVGDRFGKLVVQRVYRDAKNRRYMSECLCDCGLIKPNASFKDLQRGVSTHCGCSPNYSNLGLPEGDSCRNSLISSYRGNADTKNLEFSLTNSECEKLFKGNCFFCGKEPSAVYTKSRLKGTYLYSGIDRVDSSKGYTLDNVNSCCAACNFLKGNKTNENFLGHIRRIYEHCCK